nr:sugar nucleotide-binding protein [uncultured Anaerostipes sp.]
MKIAIVGSSGYIAGYLIGGFSKQPSTEQILKIDQKEGADEFLNLTEAEKFNYDSLNDIDLIVFTAAVSGPDKCADEFDFCWKVNVEGTSTFIENAIKRNCNVLFFSSDAVFGDIPGYIYDEESDTKAVTPYGRMKKAVEDKFKDSPNFKAIRLSYVASARDRFVTYCLNCIRNNEMADVFHPFYRNCIVVSDVVNVVLWMSQHWSEYKPFVLDVAGKELVSRVRIADEINRIFDNKLKYIVSAPNEDFFKNRPKTTQMRSLYIQEYKILEDNTFTEKLQKELEEIKL